MNGSILILLPRCYMAIKNHAVSTTIKVDLIQYLFLALNFRLFLNSGETLLDAGHDANIEKIQSMSRLACPEGSRFPSRFSDIIFYWVGVSALLCAGWVGRATGRLEMGVDMARQRDLKNRNKRAV